MGLPRPRPSDPVSLSTRLWDISWVKHFPLGLSGNVTVEPGTYDHVAQFMGRHAAKIYATESSPFLTSEQHPARDVFYREQADCFVFRDGSEAVGIFVGHPTDWSTYYIRNISLLPSHQSRGYYQKFLAHLLACLHSHGVDRVEIDIAPGNPRHIHVVNKLGFRNCGVLLSERWGALIRFILHLRESHRKIFARQFCVGEETRRNNALDLRRRRRVG